MHVKHLEYSLTLSMSKTWSITIVFIMKTDVEKEPLT